MTYTSNSKNFPVRVSLPVIAKSLLTGFFMATDIKDVIMVQLALVPLVVGKSWNSQRRCSQVVSGAGFDIRFLGHK